MPYKLWRSSRRRIVLGWFKQEDCSLVRKTYLRSLIQLKWHEWQKMGDVSVAPPRISVGAVSISKPCSVAGPEHFIVKNVFPLQLHLRILAFFSSETQLLPRDASSIRRETFLPGASVKQQILINISYLAMQRVCQLRELLGTHDEQSSPFLRKVFSPINNNNIWAQDGCKWETPQWGTSKFAPFA